MKQKILLAVNMDCVSMNAEEEMRDNNGPRHHGFDEYWVSPTQWPSYDIQAQWALEICTQWISRDIQTQPRYDPTKEALNDLPMTYKQPNQGMSLRNMLGEA